jgi:hypothetical protein
LSGHRVLFAVAESCPFDSLLVRDMKKTIGVLMQLNLKRFRVPERTMTKYSAIDVMKQALELLYEFSPSEKSYREAMRTIQVYSEGDDEMAQTLRTGFRFIANAVYSVYAGQRRCESLAPDILYLQGIPFDPTELQQAFRFVGVRPPDPSPSSVKSTIFLDEGFEPYNQFLAGKITSEQVEVGRELHWARRIENVLLEQTGTALMRVGSERFDSMGLLRGLIPMQTGRIVSLLRERNIQIKIIEKVADVNQVFGKR